MELLHANGGGAGDSGIGPIYDLPGDVRQEVVCDERNREYLLLTTEQGGVAIIPYMDENGEQEIMPQA